MSIWLMMIAMSDDLPGPRPPLATMFNMLESKDAFQSEWKAGGMSSDIRLIVI